MCLSYKIGTVSLVPQKKPSTVDSQVGNRVRVRRMLLGMSQERLGELLGLTFQQVQKYEKGTNRIGAGRLFQIAQILGVPIDYFYEGAEAHVNSSASMVSPPVAEFLSSSEGLQLAMAFTQIRSMKLRRRVVELVRTMADEEKEI